MPSVIFTCKVCGKKWKAFKSRKAKYCSKRCMNKAMLGNHNGCKGAAKWYHLKCNGPLCRGRYFMSKTKTYKFCVRCHQRIHAHIVDDL